jgi:hypothetical protein
MSCITVTASGGGIGRMVPAVQVQVLTGAGGTQPGATLSVTPQASGSLISDPGSANTEIIAAESASWPRPAVVHAGIALMPSSPTTAGVPVALGAVIGGTDINLLIAPLEVLANGTLAEDSSTPSSAR